MNEHEGLFDALDEEWRTTPTDLAGWANRANQMKTLAKRYHAALETIVKTTKLGGAADIARKALERR